MRVCRFVSFAGIPRPICIKIFVAFQFFNRNSDITFEPFDVFFDFRNFPARFRFAGGCSSRADKQSALLRLPGS